MYIFYDFETSSKELIGQILTYSFIVTDSDFNIKDELTGQIKLNRIQLPEIDALLTNRIEIDKLQKEGEPENIAAKNIYNFLSKQIATYAYCTLTGFNSNSFDVSFLRNLLIRYGINPYFEGKLLNLDILHYIRHLAFENPEKYLWSLIKNKNNELYYSFKLEDTAKAFAVLTEKQTHNARDDVLLLINLVKFLEKEFDLPLDSFRPMKVTSNFNEPFSIAKQKVSDYDLSTDSPPEKYTYKYYLNLLSQKKSNIILDLEKYEKLNSNNTKPTSDNPEEKNIMSCIRYINHNKHFFRLEPLTNQEFTKWNELALKAQSEELIQTLTPDKYFQLIKKDWDIEYQIHELGFDRIPKLQKISNKFFENPDLYSNLLMELINNRREGKDNYLIQLFNRNYLNYHPNPNPKHIMKYIEPRYLSGTMLRNHEDFTPLDEFASRLDNILESEQSSPEDKTLMRALKNYYISFCKINSIF
jgi:hypothetical protein